MALYYNLTQLLAQNSEEESWIKEQVVFHIKQIERRLPKLERAVHKKKYEKVLKQVALLKPTVVLFELHEALHLLNTLLLWEIKQGKKREGKELMEALHKSLQKTLKELKRDFLL